MIKYSACLMLVLLPFISLQARDFKTYTIPGAVCGNGMPYKVWVDTENVDSEKLAVEFMGGGACWSVSTCYGPNLRAWVHPLPKLVSKMNIMVKKGSPLENHSVLYFPYCTADVFAGNHKARYRLKSKVHHKGYSNIQKTINYLQKKKVINFKSLNDIVLYGSSAGGIGSLLHSVTFDKIVPMEAKRTIISDSPGLHFGIRFWNKFTPRTLKDFKSAFLKVGLNLSDENGMIAPQMPKVCKRLSHWNIGVLQGARDFVMSTIFGNISAKDHRALVYSRRGILNVTSEVRNCSAWAPDSRLHAFMLFPETAATQAAGVSALDYATEIYEGRTDINYR